MLADYKICSEIFEKNGLILTEEMYVSFDKYADFLYKYNKNINLTAITDAEGILIKHFLDSVLLVKYVKIPDGASIIDVGTGAGFPSVPMKLYRPDIKITLLDSLNKRIVFLRELADMLKIDAECIHSRAELLANDKNYRDKYDIAVARAVAAMPVLCEYCMPFVKPEGKFIAMKGPNEDFKSAKSAVYLLGGKIFDDIEYSLNGLEQRHAFIIKKISHTPSKYPRNSGQIKSKPL